MVADQGEFYDGENEGDGRRGDHSYKRDHSVEPMDGDSKRVKIEVKFCFFLIMLSFI